MNQRGERPRTYSLARVTQLAEEYRNRLLGDDEDLSRLVKLPVAQRRTALEERISELLAKDRIVLSREERDHLLNSVLNESVGFGPLEPLLQDPEVTEVMVNGPREVFVERRGIIAEAEGVAFKDDEHIRHVIDRIIGPLGRRIDESSPMVDARLPEGHRVNAVIKPISLAGPLLTIRKFHQTPFQLDDLVDRDGLTPAMAAFLVAAVTARLNILISGGTGSGKTTLLSAIASAIPDRERVLIIEDMAELRLKHRHVLSLEARPANVEGRGEVTIRQLVRNALRMRPDRIIVGEVRGPEAFDMLQAMNTGHEGSLTTIHANSVADAFNRLESMVLMSGTGLTVDVIRQHLVSALDLIVQTSRLEDGTRRVVSIADVRRRPGEPFRVEELFRFERAGVSPDGTVLGRFTALGLLPDRWERMKAYGVAPPETLFRAGR